MQAIGEELAVADDLGEAAGDRRRRRQVLILREARAQHRFPEREQERDRRQPQPVDAREQPLQLTHARSARPEAMKFSKRQNDRRGLRFVGDLILGLMSAGRLGIVVPVIQLLLDVRCSSVALVASFGVNGGSLVCSMPNLPTCDGPGVLAGVSG